MASASGHKALGQSTLCLEAWGCLVRRALYDFDGHVTIFTCCSREFFGSRMADPKNASR